jgi:microcompartment protein CcmL/EutN
MKEALGLIETKGLVACIEAADAMCKSRQRRADWL